MTGEEIEAIVDGYHGDAFRILGPHAVRKKNDQPRWEVRAFLPHAESAAVVVGGSRCEMVKKHAQGFFCAVLDGEPAPYELRAHLWDGREVRDRRSLPLRAADFRIDLYLHSEGTLYEACRRLGAHPVVSAGVRGVRFAVWAPNAETVSLAGEFNDWDTRRHPMRRRNGGVWEMFMPGLGEGASYKYNVRSRFAAYQQLKADPYAFYCETAAEIGVAWCGITTSTNGRTRHGWRPAPRPTG